jgi:hypothetical protein
MFDYKRSVMQTQALENAWHLNLKEKMQIPYSQPDFGNK